MKSLSFFPNLVAPSLLLLGGMRSRLAQLNEVSDRKKWIVLGFLLVFELILFVAIQKQETRTVTYGYMLKDGHQYLIAWKEEEGQFQVDDFESLKGALDFANEKLFLHPAQMPQSSFRFPIERVWVSGLQGDFRLLWKTSNLPYLFRWTFQQEKDAKFFAQAFESGAYTHSPFGHSVLLLPKK